jgi:hypothetical protein
MFALWAGLTLPLALCARADTVWRVWFFKEGEGARWANARYREFRIDADGRALLVGLRGAGLEKV